MDELEEMNSDRKNEEEIMSEKKKEKMKKKKEKEKRKGFEVVIETVEETEDKMLPCVGYFPSGFDPVKHQRIHGKESNPNVSLYRHEKFPNRMQLVVTPKGSNVDFVGSSHSGEGTTHNPCSYAIGIFDKVNCTLKMVPIAGNKIFRLEPKVRGVAHQESYEETTKEEDWNKIRELTNLYGNRASKMQARRWEAMRNQGDAETQKVTESKVEDIEINKESLEGATKHGGQIPPHDATADSPEKVYPLDKIILDSEWDHLGDVLELLESEGAVAAREYCRENQYSSFVYNRLHKLENIKDEDEKLRIGGILSYINYLLKFRNLSSSDQSSAPLFRNANAYHRGIPVILFQRFSNLFGASSSEGRKMPLEKFDLLVSYILVLTLFADAFDTTSTDIARDLQMTESALTSRYKLLGCRVQAHSITLPVPLKLPVLKRPILAKKRA